VAIDVELGGIQQLADGSGIGVDASHGVWGEEKNRQVYANRLQLTTKRLHLRRFSLVGEFLKCRKSMD
jgi:hypothetical protein